MGPDGSVSEFSAPNSIAPPTVAPVVPVSEPAPTISDETSSDWALPTGVWREPGAVDASVLSPSDRSVPSESQPIALGQVKRAASNPIEILRGTEIVEIYANRPLSSPSSLESSGPDGGPSDETATSQSRAVVLNGRSSIRPISRDELIPDLVFRTVEISEPRSNDERLTHSNVMVPASNPTRSVPGGAEGTEPPPLESPNSPQASAELQMLDMTPPSGVPKFDLSVLDDEEAIPEFGQNRRTPRFLAVAAVLTLVGVGVAMSGILSRFGVTYEDSRPVQQPGLSQVDLANPNPEWVNGVDSASDQKTEHADALNASTRDVVTAVEGEPLQAATERSFDRVDSPDPQTPAPTNVSSRIKRKSTPPVKSPTRGTPKSTTVRNNREEAERLYVRANRFLHERKYQLAIVTLKDCLELDPRHGGAYRSLGVSYMTLGQERAAIQAYEKFIRILPTHRDAGAVRQIIADFRSR